MPRKAHKYHYIYKTTCNVTGKYYIGMHSSSNLEDGYMGSGKRLRRSLIKHGIENHSVEILEFLDDRESLAKRESEIVNEQSIEDPLCMNLKLGGSGGFTDECLFGETHREAVIKSNKNKWNDPIFREKQIQIFRESMIKRHESGEFKGRKTFLNKSHSEETKIKMSESAKNRNPEKNSQFGTCWITNGIQSMKIHKGDSIPEGWSLGRKNKTAISLES